MKKITGLVIILAVLILGSYYGMGLITERTLKKNLAMVNQSNGLYVDIASYHRGWFQSTAMLNWRLHTPSYTTNQNGQATVMPAKDYQAQMPLTVFHGPIIYADSGILFGLGYARTNLEMPATYNAQFEQTYTKDSVKPQLNLGIFVNYLNKTYLHADVPKFKLITKQGNTQFEWLGMETDVRVAPKMDQIEGAIEIDGMTLVKDSLQATIGKVKSNYDLQQTEGGLYSGDVNLSLPAVLVINNKQKVFEVEDFDAHSTSDVHEGLFSSSFKLALDKIFTNGKFYGPAKLSISIKNLDAQVLASINQQVAKIQQGPDSERQRALLSLLPALPKLLSKGAEFEISDLNVTVPEGVIKGNLLIALPSENLGNPFQLIQKIQGNGRVDVSAAVLKASIKDAVMRKLKTQMSAQLPQGMLPQGAPVPATANQAAPAEMPIVAAAIEQQATQQVNEKILALVKAGALSVQGDSYVVELKLAQGQLTVNGKPFNPAMMQF